MGGEFRGRRSSVGGDDPGASSPRYRATGDSGFGTSGYCHYRRLRRAIERVAGWCRNSGGHKTHFLVTTSGAPPVSCLARSRRSLQLCRLPGGLCAHQCRSGRTRSALRRATPSRVDRSTRTTLPRLARSGRASRCLPYGDMAREDRYGRFARSREDCPNTVVGDPGEARWCGNFRRRRIAGWM